MPTLTTLVSFNGTNGAQSFAGLSADASGNLFGTTSKGGASGFGTVFEVAQTGGSYASSVTTLASFNGTNGATPEAGLVFDVTGNLFGTTSAGSPNSGQGTVFEIAKTSSGYANTLSTLVSFDGVHGSDPKASLLFDNAGTIFGTTYGGGTSGDGTVFSISGANVGGESFTGANGAAPYSYVAVDAAGDLIGTTSSGGANNDGTIFEIANTASGYATIPTALVNFNGVNGASPLGGLIFDVAGDLFGVTSAGGANNDGTVYIIAKTSDGYASAPITLATFNGTNGKTPVGSLIADAAGDLFGVTYAGGANNDGTVFEIVRTSNGYSTTPISIVTFNGANGQNPLGSLFADATGNLLGTTSSGGAGGQGTVFEISNAGFQLVAIQGVFTGLLPTRGSLTPFAHAHIADLNNSTETVSVILSSAANGALSNLGGGTYDSVGGVYTVTGSSATVTTALDGLVFTPAAASFSGTTVTTTFTIVDTNTAGDIAKDTNTSVAFNPNGSGPISAITAVQDFAAGALSAGTVVADTAAQVSANLDGLQAIAHAGDLASVTLTDGGTPYIALTATQLTNDSPVLADITSAHALSIGAVGANLTIAGVNPTDIVVFAGNANQYAIASANSGTSFTVTDTGTGRTSVDHLSNLEFVQFADRMMFVATKAEAQIALLYQGTLGRTPDIPGQVGWQNAFATESAAARAADNFTSLAGTPVGGLPDLAYGFTQSTEFQQKYGTLTDTQFVTQLYANVLDRTPDTPGLQGWVNALAQGHTREWVLVGFVESPEAYQNAEMGYVGQTGTLHQPWLVVL